MSKQQEECSIFHHKFTCTLIFTLEGHTEPTSAVAWPPDGRRAGLASWDATVRLWDSLKGKHLKKLRGHTSCVWGVAWLPDGRLASSSADRRVRV